MSETNWFICTVSSASFHNWEICREFKLWGIPSGNRKIDMEKIHAGDSFFIYWAGHGFIANGIFESKLRKPGTKEEAPWAGGIFRYGAIVDITVKREIREPIKVDFFNQRIIGTDITATALRSGLSRITKKDANKILSEYFK